MFQSLLEVKIERLIGRFAIVSFKEEKFLTEKIYLSGDPSKFSNGQMVDAKEKFLQPILTIQKN